MPLDSQIFFLFVMSGFITVWSFRYFTKSQKTAEFEYLGLSAFWGVMMLMLYGMIPWLKDRKEVFSSAYGAGAVLAVLGFIAGWIGSRVVRTKTFRKITNELRTE